MRSSYFSLPLFYRTTPLVGALCLALVAFEAAAQATTAPAPKKFNLSVPISGLENADVAYGTDANRIRHVIDTGNGVEYTFLPNETVKSSVQRGLILGHIKPTGQSDTETNEQYVSGLRITNLNLQVENNTEQEIAGADLRFYNPNDLTTPNGKINSTPFFQTDVSFTKTSIAATGEKAGQTVTGLILGDKTHLLVEQETDVNVVAKATEGNAVGFRTTEGKVTSSGRLQVTAEGKEKAVGLHVDLRGENGSWNLGSQGLKFSGKTEISAIVDQSAGDASSESDPEVKGLVVNCNGTAGEGASVQMYNGEIHSAYKGSAQTAEVVGVDIDIAEDQPIHFGTKEGTRQENTGTVNITAENKAGRSVGLKIAVADNAKGINIFYSNGTIMADTALEMNKQAQMTIQGKVVFDGKVQTGEDTHLTLSQTSNEWIDNSLELEAVFQDDAQIDGWLDVKQQGKVTIGTADKQAAVSVKKAKSSDKASWTVAAGSSLNVLKTGEAPATNLTTNAYAETPDAVINNLTNGGTVSAAGGKAKLTGTLEETETTGDWTASRGGELHFKNTHAKGAFVSLGCVKVVDNGSAVRFDSDDDAESAYEVRDLMVAGALNVQNRAKVTVTDAFAAGPDTVIRVGTEGAEHNAASLTVNRTPAELNLKELLVGNGSQAHFIKAEASPVDKNHLNIGTIVNAGTVDFDGADLTAAVSQKGDWALRNSDLSLSANDDTLAMGSVTFSGQTAVNFTTKEKQKVSIDHFFGDEASNNELSVRGGTIEVSQENSTSAKSPLGVIGAFVSDGASLRVENNQVSVTDTLITSPQIIGAQSKGGTNSTIGNNKVTVSDASLLKSDRIAGAFADEGTFSDNAVNIGGNTHIDSGNSLSIIGALLESKSESASGSLIGNSVSMTGGSINGALTIAGAQALTNGLSVDAQNNRVTLQNGSIATTELYGAKLSNGCASDNHVSINGGQLQGNELIGASVGNGTAIGNTLNISGGTLDVVTLAGASIGTGGENALSGNTVNISGGQIKTAYIAGGLSNGSASANGNRINITGGEFANRSNNFFVLGGYAKVGSSTDNTVTIGGTAKVDKAWVLGGLPFVEKAEDSLSLTPDPMGREVVKGNRFIKTSDTAVDTVAAFEDIEFDYSGNAGIGQLGLAKSAAVDNVTIDTKIHDVILSGNIVNELSFEGSGPMSCEGNLVKTGTGTLTLSGNNTYTGTTRVAQGKLRFEKSESVGKGAQRVDVDAVYEIGFSGDLNQSLSGEGNLSIDAGAGTLNLKAVQNHVGATVIKSGELRLEGGDKLVATGALTVAEGAKLSFDRAKDVEWSNKKLANHGSIALSGSSLTIGNQFSEGGWIDLTGSELRISDQSDGSNLGNAHFAKLEADSSSSLTINNKTNRVYEVDQLENGGSINLTGSTLRIGQVLNEGGSVTLKGSELQISEKSGSVSHADAHFTKLDADSNSLLSIANQSHRVYQVDQFENRGFVDLTETTLNIAQAITEGGSVTLNRSKLQISDQIGAADLPSAHFSKLLADSNSSISIANKTHRVYEVDQLENYGSLALTGSTLSIGNPISEVGSVKLLSSNLTITDQTAPTGFGSAHFAKLEADGNSSVTIANKANRVYEVDYLTNYGTLDLTGTTLKIGNPFTEAGSVKLSSSNLKITDQTIPTGFGNAHFAKLEADSNSSISIANKTHRIYEVDQLENHGSLTLKGSTLNIKNMIAEGGWIDLTGAELNISDKGGSTVCSNAHFEKVKADSNSSISIVNQSHRVYQVDQFENEGSLALTGTSLSIGQPFTEGGSVKLSESELEIFDQTDTTDVSDAHFSKLEADSKSSISIVNKANRVYEVDRLENHGLLDLTGTTLKIGNPFTEAGSVKLSSSDLKVSDQSGTAGLLNAHFAKIEADSDSSISFTNRTHRIYEVDYLENRGSIALTGSTLSIGQPFTEGGSVKLSESKLEIVDRTDVNDVSDAHFSKLEADSRSSISIVNKTHRVYEADQLENHGSLALKGTTLNIGNVITEGGWIDLKGAELNISDQTGETGLPKVHFANLKADNDSSISISNNTQRIYEVDKLENQGALKLTRTTLNIGQPFTEGGSVKLSESKLEISDQTDAADVSDGHFSKVEADSSSSISITNKTHRVYEVDRLENHGSLALKGSTLSIGNVITEGGWIDLTGAELNISDQSSKNGSANAHFAKIKADSNSSIAIADNNHRVYAIDQFENHGLLTLSGTTFKIGNPLTEAGSVTLIGSDLQIAANSDASDLANAHFAKIEADKNSSVTITDKTHRIYEVDALVNRGSLDLTGTTLSIGHPFIEGGTLKLTASNLKISDQTDIVGLPNAKIEKLEGDNRSTIDIAHKNHRFYEVGDLQNTGSLSLQNATLILTGSKTPQTAGKLKLGADAVLDIKVNEATDIGIDSLSGTGGVIRIDGVKPGAVQIGHKAPDSSLTLDVTPAVGNGYADEFSFVNDAARTVLVRNTETPAGSPASDRVVADRIIGAEGDVYGSFDFEVTDGKILGLFTENQKLAAYDFVQTLSTFAWRHDMNDLTKRMGELRDAPAGIGTWARAYGSEQQIGTASSTNNAVQVGIDTSASEYWTLGTAFTYTKGDSKYTNGTAEMESFGFGAYCSWLAENGQFVDLIAKYSHISNDFSLDMMKGDFKTDGMSVSAEAGWKFDVSSQTFIEPQAELSWGKVNGQTVKTSNGVTLVQDDSKALIGRIGLRSGVVLPDNLGNIYLRASVVHDFEGKMRTIATKDMAVKSVESDLGGTWVEYAVGANVMFDNASYLYTDFESTDGGKVKENWRWNLGLRHMF